VVVWAEAEWRLATSSIAARQTPVRSIFDPQALI
jgi:hypothetical protein